MNAKEQLKPISQKIHDYLLDNINKPITHEELINVAYGKVYNKTTQKRTIDVYLIKVKDKLLDEGFVLYRNHKAGYLLAKH